LVVWGAQDRLVPLSHASLYAEGIPGAKLAVIDGCGHAPVVERPDEFARLVGEFLADKEA
jgi:4,5:9,10-diseco-3-hydroxy-5,9,17-trioxoandrosta-1(10),2-diene-4-oate hydrolase